jgi:hypothetical protein
MDVIQQETSPYQFKILLFPPDQGQMNREIENEMKNEL